MPGPTLQSSLSYTWDAGNPLTQAVDSIAGTITRTYNGLNRLTQEATPQGTVNYTYDNAGGGEFTDRENDNTGLYLNRARYYSPAFQRFIAQDPIDFHGGLNLYAYALNNPISLRELLGLCGESEPHAQPEPEPTPGPPSPPSAPSPPFWCSSGSGPILAVGMGLSFDLAAEAIVEGMEITTGPAGTILGISLDMAFGAPVDLVHDYLCE